MSESRRCIGVDMAGPGMGDLTSVLVMEVEGGAMAVEHAVSWRSSDVPGLVATLRRDLPPDLAEHAVRLVSPHLDPAGVPMKAMDLFSAIPRDAS